MKENKIGWFSGGPPQKSSSHKRYDNLDYTWMTRKEMSNGGY